MRRYAIIALCLAIAAGFAWAQARPTPTSTPKTTTPPVVTHKNGEITGSVTSIESQKSTDKGLLMIVKISGESQSLILNASPQNRAAYATCGGLKVGEKVRASWMSDSTSEKKWITQITITEAIKPATSTPKTEIPKGESKTGEISGNVTGVDAQKSTDKGLLIEVKVSGEGQSLTLEASPQNSGAYGMSGELKVGEKVKITWKSEFAADKKWISQLQVITVPPKPTTTRPTTTKPPKTGK